MKIYELFENIDSNSNEFKQWFSGSKIVDGFGKPLPVFHGSYNKFDQFNDSFIGTRDPGFYGTGFYFTPYEEDADEYAWNHNKGTKGFVKTVFLSIKNPFIWDTSTKEKAYKTLQILYKAKVFDPKYVNELTPDRNLSNSDERKKFDRYIRDNNYDGIIVNGPMNENLSHIREIIALQSMQIKIVNVRNSNVLSY